MSRTRRFLVVATMFALTSFCIPAISAQEARQQELLNGQTLAWSAEWTLQPGLGVASEQLEIVALNRDGALVAYGGTAEAMPGSSVRDQVLAAYTEGSTLETIERGEYNNVSYSVDLAMTDTGRSLVVFTLVIENPGFTSISMQITAPDRFQETMEAAQASVTVSGSPIFDGIDAAMMQTTVDGATAGLPVAAASPVAVPEATPGTDTDRQRATIPSSGTEVTWTEAWERAAASTAAEGALELTTTSTPAARLNVVDLGAQQGDIDASDLAERIVGESSLAGDEVVAAANGDDGRKVIVLSESSDQGDILILYDLRLDPDATIAVVLTVFESDLAAAVELASASVEIDGTPAFTDVRALVPEAFEPAA